MPQVRASPSTAVSTWSRDHPPCPGRIGSPFVRSPYGHGDRATRRRVQTPDHVREPAPACRYRRRARMTRGCLHDVEVETVPPSRFETARGASLQGHVAIAHGRVASSVTTRSGPAHAARYAVGPFPTGRPHAVRSSDSPRAAEYAMRRHTTPATWGCLTAPSGAARPDPYRHTPSRLGSDRQRRPWGRTASPLVMPSMCCFT